jgi:hypothetical protein
LWWTRTAKLKEKQINFHYYFYRQLQSIFNIVMENWVNNCKCLLLKTVKMLDHRSLHFVLFDRKLHTNSQRKNSQRLFILFFYMEKNFTGHCYETRLSNLFQLLNLITWKMKVI